MQYAIFFNDLLPYPGAYAPIPSRMSLADTTLIFYGQRRGGGSCTWIDVWLG